MEAYKSHMHLEDVLRRTHLCLRIKETIQEGLQAIVRS